MIYNVLHPMKPSDTSDTDPWHFPRPDLAAAYLQAFDLKLSSARGLLPAALERGYLVAYTNLWDDRCQPAVA